MNKISLELKNLIMDIIHMQKQDLAGLVSNPETDFSRNILKQVLFILPLK